MLEEIIERIRTGKLLKTTDDRGCGGFWDLSSKVVAPLYQSNPNDESAIEDIQVDVFNKMWEIAQILVNVKDEYSVGDQKFDEERDNNL